jgi:hypothetical protein
VLSDRQKLLETLRGELAFIESGGYRKPDHAEWRAQFVFEDSPTCPNGDPGKARKPCSECLLMAFVPEDQRKMRIPCRFIPLNAAGETLDSLYRSATQEEVEAAAVEWLKATIDRLQRESEEAAEKTITVHVKAKVTSFD